MNQNERRYFSEKELELYDATSLPLSYLVKSLWVKMRRQTWGRFTDRGARFVWTASAVSDATGPADNVRNYVERENVRSMLKKVVRNYPVNSACEVGCGYGRLTMVLKEFTQKVAGFEREKILVDIAKPLLPAIEFYHVESLDKISELGMQPFDFVMMCTVLQHLTDDFCQKVIEDIKRLAPMGHVLLIEKTEPIAITANTKDDTSFISRDRSVETYTMLMNPFKLAATAKRMAEPTYFNPHPGTCMLFKSPLLK